MSSLGQCNFSLKNIPVALKHFQPPPQNKDRLRLLLIQRKPRIIRAMEPIVCSQIRVSEASMFLKRFSFPKHEVSGYCTGMNLFFSKLKLIVDVSVYVRKATV